MLLFFDVYALSTTRNQVHFWPGSEITEASPLISYCKSAHRENFRSTP